MSCCDDLSVRLENIEKEMKEMAWQLDPDRQRFINIAGDIAAGTPAENFAGLAGPFSWLAVWAFEGATPQAARDLAAMRYDSMYKNGGHPELGTYNKSGITQAKAIRELEGQSIDEWWYGFIGDEEDEVTLQTTMRQVIPVEDLIIPDSDLSLVPLVPPDPEILSTPDFPNATHDYSGILGESQQEEMKTDLQETQEAVTVLEQQQNEMNFVYGPLPNQVRMHEALIQDSRILLNSLRDQLSTLSLQVSAIANRLASVTDNFTTANRMADSSSSTPSNVGNLGFPG